MSRAATLQHSVGGSAMRDAVALSLVAASYFLGHQLAFLIPDQARLLMVIWPPAGIGLASLLLNPRRRWPAILATLFATGMLADLLAHRPFVACLGFMTANIVESLGCALLLTARSREPVRFATSRDVIALLVATGGVNAGTAVIGAGTAALAGGAHFGQAWFAWWVSDGLGILLITPLVVSWVDLRRSTVRIRWTLVGEWTAFMILWGALAWASFDLVPGPLPAVRPYILLALLAWPAFRLGQPTVTLALVSLGYVALSSRSVIQGPLSFGGGDSVERVLLLEVFLAVTSVAGMLMTASRTETQRAVDRLRQSESFLTTVIEHSPNAMWVSDREGTLIRINQACLSAMKVAAEEVVGRYSILKDEIVQAAGLMPLVRRVFERGETCRFDLDYDTERLGHIKLARPVHRIIDVTISPIRDENGRVANAVIQHVDITDRVRMQEQILHAQKLESLGVLAGGIAHDFNNLLQAMMGNAGLVRALLPKGNPALARVEEIEKAGRRAADLTQQMLAYSGRGRSTIRTINLNEAVREVATLLRSSVSKQARLLLELSPTLPGIEVDVAKVQQILMNLMLNASEALAPNREGTIRLVTGVRHATPEELAGSRLPEKPAEGEFVCLEVSDDGSGMDSPTLEKLFDPFFTTKFTGRGLGMAAVLGIVRSHKGAITVESTPGAGTTVRVLFPALQTPAPPPVAEEGAAFDPPPSAGGVVLLADGEPAVRELGRHMLEQLGYEVRTAADGAEAVDAYRRERTRIACVVLDLSLPGMGGEEAFRELRRLDPDCRIVLASGDSEEELEARVTGFGGCGLLKKPYNLGAMSDRLREAIDAG